MTSSERDLNLGRLIRAIVQTSIAEAQGTARTPRTLSGAVEDLDESLDVVFVRMDQEAMGSDPTQSDNYEAPGVIPASRSGETFTDEQVRVNFDPRSGADAMRTSTESRIVLPFGAESGQRIIIDGVEEGGGFIVFVNADDEIVGYLDPTQWFVGTPGSALARLDPLGGLRLRDENDILRVLLSASEGLTLRDAASGLSGFIARSDGLTILDPVTGEHISISSGSISSIPTPKWVSSTAEGAVGSSHSTPAVASFATGDDIDLRFVCASAAANLGAHSYTPPTNYTERSDSHSAGSITLATSSATRDPALASPGVASFTNTSSAWTRRNGHSVIIRGGGGTSPSFRSASQGAPIIANGPNIDFEIDAPPLTAEGDMLVAHVAIAGPNIPVGWIVPEGWVQLGVQVAGLGTNHILGSGIWFKRAGASEPASEPIALSLSAAGATKVQATVVAIQNPYGFPAGLDIRRNNRSMPRGEIDTFVSSASTGQIAGTSMPVTVDSLNNVPLHAGRTYLISYDVPIYEFQTLSDGNICAVWIEMDTGGGFTNFLRTHRRTLAGSSRGGITLAREYRPASDQTISLRTRLTASGTNFTMELFGAALEQRKLTVEDKGAVF